jgi:hypothetical protein
LHCSSFQPKFRIRKNSKSHFQYYPECLMASVASAPEVLISPFTIGLKWTEGEDLIGMEIEWNGMEWKGMEWK